MVGYGRLLHGSSNGQQILVVLVVNRVFHANGRKHVKTTENLRKTHAKSQKDDHKIPQNKQNGHKTKTTRIF